MTVLADQTDRCPPHLYTVRIVTAPSGASDYEHRCAKCGLTKNVPISYAKAPRWGGGGVRRAVNL